MAVMRVLITLSLLSLGLLQDVRADASSTSHVSISLGKSSVKYNNDHVTGGSPYSPKHHFSPTPFHHSSPAPPYHQEHPRQSPGYHHSTLAPPAYGSSPHGPFYHSTPAPSPLYSSTPQYYSPSTPVHGHAGHLPKNTEAKEHRTMPKEIEKNMKELKMDEGEKKVEEKEQKEEEEMEEKEQEKEEASREEHGYHATAKPIVYHPSTASYSSRPRYHPSEEPLYIPKRHYAPHPAHPIHKSPPPPPHHSYQPLHQPAAGPHYEEGHHESAKPPKCAEDDEYYCEKDEDYPQYEIMNAAQKHADGLLALYADVADLNTERSVDLPDKADGQESYVCPADVTYAQLFRAKNTHGKWRIIVNDIKLNYQILTQTVRLEECLMGGQPCPLVPHCYESKCLQKFVYHKFLVFDPYDRYFPFAIESFRLPASCSCHLDDYEISH